MTKPTQQPAATTAGTDPPAKAAAKRPVMPLRRLAIATVDTAALVATGAVAEFGVMGVAAGAAAAVGVPLVARASRASRGARARRAATRSARSSGLSLPRLGGAGRGSKSGTGTGARSGNAGRRLRGLLPGGSRRTGAGLTGRGRASGGARSAGSAGRAAGGRTGTGGSGKPLRLFDRLTGRNPSLRQERRHARQLARDGVKFAEWARRRRERRQRKQAKKRRHNTNGRPQPKVSTKLRGDNQTKNPLAPVPVPVPGGATQTAQPNGSTMRGRTVAGVASPTMRRMLAAAEQMTAIAVKYAPEGNLEVLEGYKDMPVIMNEVVKALGHFHKSAAQQGLHPAVVDFVEAMVKAQRATSTAAAAIAPAIEKLHKDELAYLRKGGSARWDRGVNGAASKTTRTPAPADPQPTAPPAP